jgi:hypothetical protein
MPMGSPIRSNKLECRVIFGRLMGLFEVTKEAFSGDLRKVQSTLLWSKYLHNGKL